MRFTKPRRLEDGETLDDFCSGVEVVDDWARNRAPYAKKRGSAIVYVSFAATEEKSVAGFYSLTSHSITRSSVNGGWLKRNAPSSIPVFLLGMLGVNQQYQGTGLGSMLLRDAVVRSLSAAGTVGAKALVVDPADEGVQGFYLHYGFLEIPGMDTMYIPLKLPE